MRLSYLSALTLAILSGGGFQSAAVLSWPRIPILGHPSIPTIAGTAGHWNARPLTARPATAAETVDAVWKEQEIEFTFLGIDTAYSCDVMEARIEMLLLHVGAEEGVFVSAAPCPGYDRPQQRIPLKARFRTLVPAAAGDANVVKAAWSEVVLGKKSPRSIVDGDCRLLEQFQKHVLPAIEHKVIEGSATCSASGKSIAGRLKLDVLKPVEGSDAGAPEREVAP